METKLDWRNAQDYEFTNQLTRDGWAWEFLRRNPEYVKEWDNALVKYQIDHGKYRDDLLPKITALLENGEGSVNLIPGYSKEVNADNLLDKERRFLLYYANQLLKKEVPSDISYKGARSKWGFCLDHLINPETDNPKTDPDIPLFKSFRYIYSRNNINRLPDLKEEEVVIVFDLSKRISPQLDYFKALLKEEQDDLKDSGKIKIRSGTNPLDTWTNHLRILDAKKENAANKEIAKIIFPKHENTVGFDYAGNTKVKDSYNAALKNVNGDYRKLFLTNPN